MRSLTGRLLSPPPGTAPLGCPQQRGWRRASHASSAITAAGHPFPCSDRYAATATVDPRCKAKTTWKQNHRLGYLATAVVSHGITTLSWVITGFLEHEHTTGGPTDRA